MQSESELTLHISQSRTDSVMIFAYHFNQRLTENEFFHLDSTLYTNVIILIIAVTALHHLCISTSTPRTMTVSCTGESVLYD